MSSSGKMQLSEEESTTIARDLCAEVVPLLDRDMVLLLAYRRVLLKINAHRADMRAFFKRAAEDPTVVAFLAQEEGMTEEEARRRLQDPGKPDLTKIMRDQEIADVILAQQDDPNSGSQFYSYRLPDCPERMRIARHVSVVVANLAFGKYEHADTLTADSALAVRKMVRELVLGYLLME